MMKRRHILQAACAGLGWAAMGQPGFPAILRNRPRGAALLLGLNNVDPAHYCGWDGKLSQSEEDARDMTAIAQAAGFETRCLLTRDATRQAVSDAVTNCAGKLRPGDIFLLYYSGHGGVLPDLNGDESIADEALCLYDAMLVDDEVRGLFSQFAAGMRILYVSDSCFSSSQSKSMPATLPEAPAPPPDDPVERILATRDMPSEMPELGIGNLPAKVYEENQAFYDAILTASFTAPEALPASVLELTACRDDELARETAFGGLFTFRLKNTWDDGRYMGDYRDFYRRISQTLSRSRQSPQMDTYGAPNPAFLAQRPFTI